MNSQKQQAVDLLKAIVTGDPDAISVINPNKYIQHNLSAADGFVGFQGLLKVVPESSSVNTVRVFQDGNYVFTHSEYNIFGPMTGFDIFRFEDGKIVEHWDNLWPKADPNPSGRTAIDGPIEVKDLDKTEMNKELGRRLVQDVLINREVDKFPGYCDGENYTQHHPMIPDGVTTLVELFKANFAAGTGSKYDRIHLVLGEGNFVLITSEGSFDGEPTSYYDMFRFENGKVVEHWDIIEPIPPRSEWKNDNGKF